MGRAEDSLSPVCLFDSNDFNFAHGVVGPECQGVLADNLDLDGSVNLIPFLVIACLERIAAKAFKERNDLLPVLS